MTHIWKAEDISPLQTLEATMLRVPFLHTAHPEWNYITGIVVNPDAEYWFDKGQVPTEEEVLKVAKRLNEYNTWYRDSWLRQMAEFAPYDIDGGANLGYFIKHCENTWSYRKRTWTHGAFWSQPRPGEDCQTLDHILDQTR